MLNIPANCDRCGSGRLRMEYQIINRNTHSIYNDLVCFDCGFHSQLKVFFDKPNYQYEYYNSYKQTHNIDYSFEQFTNKIINHIKARVVETVLKDEGSDQLGKWTGYVEQEVYQFLRW